MFCGLNDFNDKCVNWVMVDFHLFKYIKLKVKIHHELRKSRKQAFLKSLWAVSLSESRTVTEYRLYDPWDRSQSEVKG